MAIKTVVNPISLRYPFELRDQPPEVVQAHRYAFQGLVDVNQAISSLKSQLDAVSKTQTGASATAGVTTNTTSTITIEDILAGLGTVNDQTGNTSYTTQTGDAGALLVLNDASPVAVSLNSVVTTPFALFITNAGAGLVTLTPTSGLINGGASIALTKGQLIWCVFGGTNWLTSAVFAPPQDTPAVTHEFITAFAASSGVFIQAQPAFTDISGSATAAQVPALSALTGAITAGQLPADVPVVSFGTGAPSGSSTEGYLYFDMTLAVYVGYVYHSGAWNQFS